MQELTVPINPASSVPLYEQIYRHITAEIREGRLPEGMRLPSKRGMCAHLGVSLSTVETAYGLLLAEGYIASRPRSGFFVAASGLPRAIHAPQPPAASPEPPQPPRLDASTSAVDTSVFPYATWARIFKQVLYDRPDLLNRGDAQGDIELREALSSFLYQYRGVRCRAEQLIVGAGMDHLLEIILRLTEGPVALEDPGYGAPYRVLQEHGRTAIPVPVNEGGMDVSFLRKTNAAIAYVTPSHQFPTGALMPVSRRMQLISWAAEQPGRFIIEDDYDSEFRYSSRPVPSLQGMTDHKNVVYAGTFSRTIAPSIRVAYMVLPEPLLAAYREKYAHAASPVSRFEQQTLARFLMGGYYARHLRRVGNLYRARCAHLARALGNTGGVRVSAADAGLHFLLTHERLSEQEMLSRALERGIRLHGLSEYCHTACPAPSTVVMGFAGIADGQRDELIHLLHEAWQD